MKAKEYLQKLEILDIAINQKIKEVDDLQRMSTCIGSFDYSKDKVQTSPKPDAPYVEILERICDLQAEINSEIDYFVNEKHKIINQIQEVTKPNYINVLFKHYVEFKKFEEIAVEMSLSYQYVIEIHGYALQEFEKIL